MPRFRASSGGPLVEEILNSHTDAVDTVVDVRGFVLVRKDECLDTFV